MNTVDILGFCFFLFVSFFAFTVAIGKGNNSGLTECVEGQGGEASGFS